MNTIIAVGVTIIGIAGMGLAYVVFYAINSVHEALERKRKLLEELRK